MMREIVLERPGRFLFREAPPPRPGPDEALVRVRRVGVCGTDLHAFAGRQPFFQYPRVLGHELGVEIVDVGPNDRGLQPGDRCAVEPYINCGRCIACRRGRQNCCLHHQTLGVHTDGGMRPYLTVPVNKLHRANRLSWDQLALVETLAVGAHAVERGCPEPGETTLVAGAGPIGLSVIQAAQLNGADVIVADINPQRLAFCRQRLGVARTIDPAAGDAAAELERMAGDLPTLVIDATGSPQSMSRCFDLAAHGGRIVFVGLFQGDLTFNDPNFHRRELTLMGSRNALPATFDQLIRWIEDGRLDTTPWITHRLSLRDVPDRFARLAEEPDLVKAVVEPEPEPAAP